MIGDRLETGTLKVEGTVLPSADDFFLLASRHHVGQTSAASYDARTLRCATLARAIWSRPPLTSETAGNTPKAALPRLDELAMPTYVADYLGMILTAETAEKAPAVANGHA